MNVLVISMAGIGDTLLATPLIHALRDAFPEAVIEALVMWKGSRELLEGNPHLNRIHQINLLQASKWQGLAFLWNLRKRRYDVSINAYPQGKIQYRAIARLIGARRRLSHIHENHTPLDGFLVTDTLPQDYSLHCIQNNLRLLRLLELPAPDAGLDAELYLGPAELGFAEQVTREHRLEGRRILGVHTGSGKTKNLILKRWPIRHYAALIRRVLEDHPRAVIVLFGGPEEEADNQYLLREINSPRLIWPRTPSLKSAAALLRKCDLFLSVDNVFMNLAATLKVPRQVVIESPTFNQTITPYRTQFRLVPNPLVAGRNLEYYRYNGRNIRGSRQHLLQCMASVTVDAVRQAVEEELRSAGTGADAG